MVSALFSCSSTDNGDVVGAAGSIATSGGSAFAGGPSNPTAGTGTAFAGSSGNPATNSAGSSGVPISGSGGDGSASSGASTGGASTGGKDGASTGGKGGTSTGGKGGTSGATGGKGGTSGGKGGSGGMSGGNSQGGAAGAAVVVQPPPLTDGTPGWATRYWDCCKPACGWQERVGAGRTPIQSCTQDDQPLSDVKARNACESGGTAYMCHALQPWAVSDTLSYGYAAVSKGNDFCGKCYQLQFTGGSHNSNVDAGSKALLGKTMIVQAINNGGVGGDQFDLLVPGGGVGALDACSKQWGTTDLGERYGGFFLACQKANDFDYAKSKACATAKCESVFANKPELLTGCKWFTGWFGAPDNPAVTYKEVTCPDAITKNSGLKR